MIDDLKVIAATAIIMIALVALATWVAVTISEPEPDSETCDAARLDAELATIAQAFDLMERAFGSLQQTLSKWRRSLE